MIFFLFCLKSHCWLWQWIVRDYQKGDFCQMNELEWGGPAKTGLPVLFEIVLYIWEDFFKFLFRTSNSRIRIWSKTCFHHSNFCTNCILMRPLLCWIQISPFTSTWRYWSTQLSLPYALGPKLEKQTAWHGWKVEVGLVYSFFKHTSFIN